MCKLILFKNERVNERDAVNVASFHYVLQTDLVLLLAYTWRTWYYYPQSKQSARLFLQSSELGPLHPLTPRRVCLPLWDTLACGRGGGEVPIPSRRHTKVVSSKRRIKTVRYAESYEQGRIVWGGKSSVKNRKGNCWKDCICFVVLNVADPGCLSRIQIFSILDPDLFHSGSRVPIKKFTYFTIKLFLSSRKYDPASSSRILILIFYPSWIPDPGVKKAPDPDYWLCCTLSCEQKSCMRSPASMKKTRLAQDSCCSSLRSSLNSCTSLTHDLNTIG